MESTKLQIEFPILIKISDDFYLMIEDHHELNPDVPPNTIVCRTGSIGEWDYLDKEECVFHGEDAFLEIERLRELEES
jgi:hypothetical protein